MMKKREKKKMRWGMVIDLTRCTGCNACVTACQAAHFIRPGVFWNRVMLSESGEFPLVTRQIMPVLCNHCDETVCVKVCPAGATQQRDDGIVWIDSDKCVGCRYCVVACPYQARTYVSKEKRYLGILQSQTDFGKIGKEIYDHQNGVAEKCNYCMERIDQGLAKGLRPGIDRDATPVCVNTCPASARHFGNLNDSESELCELIRKHGGATFHPEFGTDPSTYYIRS